MKSHQDIDVRTLAIHQLIADKIRQNPELFEKVKETLSRWRQTVSPSSKAYLSEWECLVNSGMEVCLTTATEESEHATALRQSSPFSNVLTNRERFLFFKSWDKNHAA